MKRALRPRRWSRCALAPASAFAHATLEASSPERGARLDARAGAGGAALRRAGGGELRRAAGVRRARAGGAGGQAVPPAATRDRVAVKLRPGSRPGGFTATYRVDLRRLAPGVRRLRVHGRRRERAGEDRRRAAAGQRRRPGDVDRVRGRAGGPVRRDRDRASARWCSCCGSGASRHLRPRARGVLARAAAPAGGRCRRRPAERASPGSSCRARPRAAPACGRRSTRTCSTPCSRPASAACGASARSRGCADADRRARRPARRRAAAAAARARLPAALGGHAGVQPPVWLNAPANVVHVLAVSAWLGGRRGARARAARRHPRARADRAHARAGGDRRALLDARRRRDRARARDRRHPGGDRMSSLSASCSTPRTGARC